MRAELEEQPSRWLALLDAQAGPLQDAAAYATSRPLRGIYFVARGSSDHAAMYAQYLAQYRLGVPSGLATPSLVTVLDRNVYGPDDLVVGVSQSGMSPDLVETLARASKAGALTVAFTNNPASDMAAAVDVHVDVCAGDEVAVAATKSFTSEMLALYLWLELAASTSWNRLRDDVIAVAEAAVHAIASGGAFASRNAGTVAAADRAVVLGRGLSMGTAREGALKLTETCRIAASGWSAADFRHGPIAQVVEGTPVVFLTGSAQGRESVEGLLPDVVGRGGVPIVIGQGHDAATGPASQPAVLELAPAPRAELVPLLEAIPLQQLALNASLQLGLDPDHPGGLTKVTSTF